MKAARYYGPENIKIEEIPIPEPGAGEIIVKNKVALTCGTDVKIYTRGYPLFKPPFIFGHEASGIVYKAGDGVTAFKTGDSVVAHNSAPCNSCYYCKQGQQSMCVNAIFNLGAFSEYQRISAQIVKQNVFHIPEGMSFKDAALTEPFSCAVYGVSEIGIEAGDTVVINGAGPIGLMFTRLAYFRGAKIIVTDLCDERLEAAKKMGASVVINARDCTDIVGIVKNHTDDGRGADVSIEAVGLPSTWESTVLMARKGGRVLLFGGTKSGSSFTIDTTLLHYSQLTIKGVFHTTPKYVQKAFNLIKNGMISAEDFVGASYPLEKLEEALLEHKQGKVIKNCIVF
ncbi:zinc-binding dehydrogenase [Pectinatus frisingensis]|uniref:zinc-binding dehydrogenase n=1 Tax=Pectinatus frisingensis TaxID=865 RepID=UPI0018C5FCF0|nr:zinc-binding dehydrogenase [Pectinatus frisingensis]